MSLRPALALSIIRTNTKADVHVLCAGLMLQTVDSEGREITINREFALHGVHVVVDDTADEVEIAAQLLTAVAIDFAMALRTGAANLEEIEPRGAVVNLDVIREARARHDEG